MKRFLLIAVFAVFAAACSKDDSVDLEQARQEIIGTWEEVGTESSEWIGYFVFSDSTFSLYSQNKTSQNIVYTYLGEAYTLTETEIVIEAESGIERKRYKLKSGHIYYYPYANREEYIEAAKL